MFYSLTIEIKNRIFLLGFTWLSGVIIAYAYKNTLLFSIIKRNITTDYFITTNVTEVFLIYFKLNVCLTNYFFILYCCYHLIMFFVSALYYTEYFFFVNILFISSLNLIFFVVFVYYIGIPITWDFFIKSQIIVSNQVVPIYFESKLHELLEFYLSFFEFGVLSSFLLTSLVFLSVEINKNLIALKKSRSTFHFSLIIIIILLTPPDLLSFLSAGLVFITTFELCVLLNSLRV
jgi:Sec-independent protein secretion pathway component TatC